MSGSTPRRTPVPAVELGENEVKDVVDEVTERSLEDQVTELKAENEQLRSDLRDAIESFRPVHVKVKDAVVTHRRQLLLAGSTVLALGAAAYVVTHKDEILDTVEHAVENTAETAELGAQAVKKDARKARTGSTTK